jgi:TPR repeat protein
MRPALLAALAASALLLAPAAPAQRAQRQAVATGYRALYDRGGELEARAAAEPPGELRLRYYRDAAAAFELALRARARERIADNRIFNALGTVYLGAGDLARADVHLREGLVIADSLTQTDKGRLFATYAYLNALRGDNRAALHYYRLSADLGNESAQRSILTLRRAQAR